MKLLINIMIGEKIQVLFNQYFPKHKYKINAGIRDDRFIMFERAVVGNEPALVEIFPSMGKAFYDYHCGLVLVESWSGTNLLSPCIMSQNPIHQWDIEGSVNENVSKKLDEVWKKTFFTKTKVLPQIIK